MRLCALTRCSLFVDVSLQVLSGESLEQDGDYYSNQGRGAEDCAPVVQSERTPRTGLRLRQVKISKNSFYRKGYHVLWNVEVRT